MKKVLFGLAVLIAVHIAALAVAPSFIDWTEHRIGIAAELERVLGRRVVIEGPVSATLLPSPRFSLHGARLGNLDGAASSDMIQVEALEIRLAFWPLLAGKIVSTSLFLHKPVFELERLADGRPNWRFSPAAPSHPATAVNQRNMASGIKFENAVIDDGIFIYRDGLTGAVERVEGVNARFAADGLNGPLRLAGELRYHSIPLRFTVSTGRLDPDGQSATPINITAEVRGQAQGLLRTQSMRGAGVFSGSFRMSETGLRLGGTTKFSGDDLTDLVVALAPGVDLPDFLAQPFSLEGLVDLQNDSLTANGMSFRLGDTRAEGAVSMVLGGNLPRLDIAMTFGRIDLDAWQVVAAKKAAIATIAGQSLASSGTTEFALPRSIIVTFDVSADALTYRGGAARRTHFAAELSDGVIDIHRFESQLPGATQLAFHGRLLPLEGRARLDGLAELASDDFRTLLGWFEVDISHMPAGRLNKILAISHLALTRDKLELDDLDLRFDNTRLTGAVVTALRDRPAIGANFFIDRIDLDIYRQSDMPASAAAASPAALSILPLSALTEFDAKLRVQLGQLDKDDDRLRDISLEASLVDGQLTIGELTLADLAGGRMSLAGKLAGFRDRLRLNLEFDMASEEPAKVLRVFGLTVPLPLPDQALKPFSAHGTIIGDDIAHKIDIAVNAGATALSLNGDLNLPRDAPMQFTLNLGFEHPDYVDLLRLYDPAFAPERSAPLRAVSLQTVFSSLRHDYSLTGLKGLFGPLTLEGSAAVDFDGPLPRVSAQFSAEDIDTRHFLSAPPKPARGAAEPQWSNAPIDMNLAGLIEGRLLFSGKSLRHGRWLVGDPKVELTLAEGGISLKQFAGRMMGGALDLQGRYGPRGETEPVMTLDYNLNLSGAELGQALFDSPGIDLAGGRLNFALEGSAVGASEADLFSALNGRGSVTLDNTQIKGFDLARLNARYSLMETPGELVRLIQSTLSSGSTRATKLDGDFTIAKGVVAFDDLRIQSPGGNVRALIAADLPAWNLNATVEIQLAATVKLPKIELQMNGPLNEPRREFESYALQSYLMDERARQAQSRPVPPTAPPPPRQAPQVPPAAP